MARYPTDDRIVLKVHIPFGQPDSAAKFGKHAGDDSANGAGTPVYAPTSGTVTDYTWGQYHGHTVEIFDGSVYPHMFHMNSILVKPGQKVKEGELVGYTGATGQGITGAHIHFGVSKVSIKSVRSFSDFIDPMAWIKSNKGDAMDRETLNYIFRLSADAEPDESTIKYWLGRPARDFAKSRYDNNEPFRYGGRHYEEDTKALHQEIEKLKEQLNTNDAAKKLQAIKDALK